MDELEQQARKSHSERDDRRKRRSLRDIPPDEAPADPELEARMRAATRRDD